MTSREFAKLAGMATIANLLKNGPYWTPTMSNPALRRRIWIGTGLWPRSFGQIWDLYKGMGRSLLAPLTVPFKILSGQKPPHPVQLPLIGVPPSQDQLMKRWQDLLRQFQLHSPSGRSLVV